MDHIFELPNTKELFTLRNDDGRNIAWDNDKLESGNNTWIPKTDDEYKFLSKLMNIAKFNTPNLITTCLLEIRIRVLSLRSK